MRYFSEMDNFARNIVKKLSRMCDVADPTDCTDVN